MSQPDHRCTVTSCGAEPAPIDAQIQKSPRRSAADTRPIELPRPGLGSRERGFLGGLVPLGATFGVFLGSGAGAIVTTFLMPIGILSDRVGRKPGDL